jgi:hypothetical protein
MCEEETGESKRAVMNQKTIKDQRAMSREKTGKV